MLQIIAKKGTVFTEEVPAPIVSDGEVLIKVLYSCISAGTEISSIETSEVALIKKIKERPERLIKALKKVKQIGIQKFYSNIKEMGSEGTPLGYSISGIVLEVGRHVDGFEIGDLVAAAGAGKANHAEFVAIPKNLVMRCPDRLDMKLASTVTLGGIALQGVRRTELVLGEICVVYGAGILGLLALQLLRLSGVRVIAIDIDQRRLEIAKSLGAETIINTIEDDPVKIVDSITGRYGADAVLFAANVNSNVPLSESFQMCKKKGKVIMLGKAELNIKRSDVYPKELDFITSTSYGPGRYDKNYEEDGIDYPYAYVRWTENRNMTEYLRLLSSKQIDISKLINEVYPIHNAVEAFNSLKKHDHKPLMVILEYNGLTNANGLENFIINRKSSLKESNSTDGIINVALIGAGPFAKAVHLPNLRSLSNQYKIHAIMSRTGYNAKNVAQDYDADYCTTDFTEIIRDSKVDLVFISTNQSNHASLTLQALRAGKNVFVEKPLATTIEELNKIIDFYKDGADNNPLLMVGFNRRFSKYITEIKNHTDKRVNPLFIQYRMNAGFKSSDSAIFDEGGRIIGEVCHIIDLMTHLTNSKIESISFESMKPRTKKFISNDNKSIILKYNDGSVCNIQYFAVGNKLLEKEYMEIHFDEKSIVLNDYRSLIGYGLDLKQIKTKESDKGHKDELIILYDTLMGKRNSWPIDLWDIIQTTEATFLIK